MILRQAFALLFLLALVAAPSATDPRDAPLSTPPPGAHDTALLDFVVTGGTYALVSLSSIGDTTPVEEGESQAEVGFEEILWEAPAGDVVEEEWQPLGSPGPTLVVIIMKDEVLAAITQSLSEGNRVVLALQPWSESGEYGVSFALAVDPDDAGKSSFISPASEFTDFQFRAFMDFRGQDPLTSGGVGEDAGDLLVAWNSEVWLAPPAPAPLSGPIQLSFERFVREVILGEEDWSDLDPSERSVLDAPHWVQEGMANAEVWVELPPKLEGGATNPWRGIDYAVCTRSSEGWNDCFHPTALGQKGRFLRSEGYVPAGEPLQVDAVPLDRGYSQPVAAWGSSRFPLATIDVSTLLRTGIVLVTFAGAAPVDYPSLSNSPPNYTPPVVSSIDEETLDVLLLLEPPAPCDVGVGCSGVFLQAFDTRAREIRHAWQVAPGGPWSEWRSLGGIGNSDQMLAAVNADGRLEVFRHEEDREISHKWQLTPGGSWSAWESLGRPPGPQLPEGAQDRKKSAVIRDGAGHIHLFAIRGADGDDLVSSGDDPVSLWYRKQTPDGPWSPWAELGPLPDSSRKGHMRVAPVVARNAAGGIELFTAGAGDLQGIWTRSQPQAGESWGSWENLGLPAGYEVESMRAGVEAATTVDGSLHLFLHGARDASFLNVPGLSDLGPLPVGLAGEDLLWHKVRSPSGIWSSGWTVLGASVARSDFGYSSLSLVAGLDPSVTVFAEATDHALYRGRLVYDLSGGDWEWNGWKNLGGTLTSVPAAERNGDGTIEVLARGQGPWDIWSIKEYPGETWGEWQNALEGPAGEPLVLSTLLEIL